MEYAGYILTAVILLLVMVPLLLLVVKKLDKATQQQVSGQERVQDLTRQVETVRQENAVLLARQDMLVNSFENTMAKVQQQLLDESMRTEQKLESVRRVLNDNLGTLRDSSAKQMADMRETLTQSMQQMQDGNSRQLENIRRTVDEKLQDTLDKKLNESFQLVSERLEQVYKGLGEMQQLANGVGDLKKVLSNVKTRGVLGEIQLGAILEQILSPEQYACNVATKPGSRDNVEYAIKLPGEGGESVWLPVDSKFPLDAYQKLLDAYETADQEQVEFALRELKQRVRNFAKDIRSKYIEPPYTTEFGIMFLPTEGLYAELVRCGMVELLQSESKVNIAGPTTMGALLNSLQMGFRTLAIQKRSNEVWQVLGKVKGEFDTFADVLDSAQRRLTQANSELDKLVGVRTRQIQRALKNVQALPAADGSGNYGEMAELEEPYV